jgi:hypothetical protein
MLGSIKDPRVAAAVGEAFGRASQSVRTNRNASARDEQLGERAREETSDTADLCKDLKGAIRQQVDRLTGSSLGGGRKVSIELYPTNLPVGDENQSGADIGVRVFIQTPRFSITKGALFQCKRMYGTLPRKRSYKEIEGRGEEQAEKMLRVTPASFFLLFNSGDPRELLTLAGQPVTACCPSMCKLLQGACPWPCDCILTGGSSTFDMGIAVLPATRIYAASREARQRGGKISTAVDHILPGSLPFGVFMVDLLASCFVGDIREDVVQLVTPPKLRDARSSGLPNIDPRDFPIRNFLDVGIEAEEG